MIELLVFDTTHHALLAEQTALAGGVAVQVTPAPADSNARCDLALEYLAGDRSRLLALLDAGDVRYRRYRRVTESGGSEESR